MGIFLLKISLGIVLLTKNFYKISCYNKKIMGNFLLKISLGIILLKKLQDFLL